MRDFIAKISLTALFVLAIFSASAAEKVTFEANSPLTVAVGEPFRVEFALNAQPEPGSFKAPSFEGFDVIAGPAEAQGQSIQIVNNSMTRVINYTITYVLVPQGAGNVGGTQVERHVAVSGFGQEFEASGVDLEDLAAVAFDDFHVILRQQTVLGFVFPDGERLLINEISHNRDMFCVC